MRGRRPLNKKTNWIVDQALKAPSCSSTPCSWNNKKYAFSFLATGPDTDNAFSLIHCFFRKGFTPPPHFHQYEDESFYILEGVIDFQAGDKKITAGPGQFIVLPKGTPHRLVTDTAKALLLITPAGFELVFREFGIPALTLDPPPLPDNLPGEMFQKIHRRCEEPGNVWMPEV